METINVHAHPSNLRYASRILKETGSLAVAGLTDRIYIVGIWEPGLQEHERLDERRLIWRVRLRAAGNGGGLVAKMMRHLEWQLRILARFRRERLAIVNCHSLAVLPLGVLLKVLTKAAVVYDTHELETETGVSRGLRRPLAKLLERALVCRAGAVITVNNTIASWYRDRYNLANVYVVRNVPYRREVERTGPSPLKQELGVPEDDMLFIYQGGLGTERGIELLLEAFAGVDSHKHIVFMGYGPLEGLVKDYARRHANIHFHAAVSPQALPEYTAGADAGLCVYENACLNHYYCLPNKVFEYIMSGLPLIVSDFPEMGRLVDEGHCGWRVPVDPQRLRALIASLTWEDIRAKKAGALAYRRTLGWHQEEPSLLSAHRCAMAQA